MEPVSQNGRPAPRPWTAQDQVIAEVAAACGVNNAEIGRAIHRRTCLVRYHLTPNLRQSLPPSGRKWTKNERVLAEVAAACGLSYSAIGRFLECTPNTVKRRLCPTAAIKERHYARNRYHSNPQKKLEQCRLYREANLEKCLEASRRRYKARRKEHMYRCRQWAIANRDRVLATQLRYRENNPDKARESRRRYLEANREKELNRRRRYCELNPDKVKESQSKYRKANRAKITARQRRRESLKRSARRRALLPATILAINARFALWRNRCAFCGVGAEHQRNHGYKRLTEEHVMALANHGLDEPSNIMPACHSCNSSKNASPVESWYRRQPFFTEARWRKIQRHCPAAVVGQLPLALPA